MTWPNSLSKPLIRCIQEISEEDLNYFVHAISSSDLCSPSKNLRFSGSWHYAVFTALMRPDRVTLQIKVNLLQMNCIWRYLLSSLVTAAGPNWRLLTNVGPFFESRYEIIPSQHTLKHLLLNYELSTFAKTVNRCLIFQTLEKCTKLTYSSQRLKSADKFVLSPVLHI